MTVLNNENKNEELAIEGLIQKGLHAKARAAIRKYRAANQTTARRFNLSEWYLRMGEPHEAIKILGAEREFKNIHELSLEDFKLATQQVYLLSFFDAVETSDRMMSQLKNVIESQPRFLADYGFVFFRNLGTMAIRKYDYRSALEAYQKAYSLSDQSDFHRSRLMQISIADGFEGCGESQKAIDMVTQILNEAKSEFKILIGIALQARGEYYFRAGEFVKARTDLEKAWEFFPKEVQTSDKAFLAKWSGALALHEGNRTRAEEELKLSADLLWTIRVRPSPLLEVYYWWAQLYPKAITQNPFRALNTHPVQSPLGCLTGRKKRAQEMLPIWIEKQLPPPNSNDCWLISNGTTVSVVWTEIRSTQKEYLDLVTGIRWHKKKKPTLLSDLMSKALKLLAASGDLGLNDWALIEKLYPGSWQEPQSMLLRLNNLIHQLRASGFKVHRRKNQFFWSPPNKLNVLLPMDQEFRGLRYDMQNDLQIQKYTAKQLAKHYGISLSSVKNHLN